MGDVPRSVQYDDVYFSAENGAAETRHVFLQGNGLPGAWQGAPRFAIGETGFGTGLNFLLAWKLFDETARAGAFLDYVSVEKHPLHPDEIHRALDPWAHDLAPYLDKMLASYPLRLPGFHRIVFDNRVALTLIFDEAQTALAQIDGAVDCWFLDGFTPAKNPDMWSPEIFNEMARLSHERTSFATFTAAGFVKRGLQAAGFHVEKRPGFGSKRDMLAGCYTHTAPPVYAAPKKVAIIGAGLAGTACAHALKQYGMTPVLYDPGGIAPGASGNVLGVAGPRISAHRTPQSDFYVSGYVALLREHGPAIHGTGSLHLVTDAEKEKRFLQTVENWGWTGDHMQWLDQKSAGDVAGVQLEQPALYLPDAPALSPRELCEFYARDAELVQTRVEDLIALDADAVILACGAAITNFHDLPLNPVRGQVTEIAATPLSEKLRCALHYGGYLSAAYDERHMLGATFQPWRADTDTDTADDRSNIQKLGEAVPALAGDYKVLGARAALRCASKDRFPVIGRLDDRLFVSGAHGSHGLVSTLVGAHLLADQLRGGIKNLPTGTQTALSPARFLKKQGTQTS